MPAPPRLRTWFSPEALKQAQTAEARGDYEGAVASFTQAGRYADAVRVMLARAQAEQEPHRRALLLVQATSLAPPGDAARVQAWRARASFILDRAEAGALDPVLRRRELVEAGNAMRALGESELAAKALRLAGDLDGELKALSEGGALGPLEEAIARQRRAEEARARRAFRFEECRDLISVGRRKDASELLETSLQEGEAEDLRALAQGLQSRRPKLPAHVYVAGKTMEILPGNPLTLGRSDGELRVPSPVVSRRHLEFLRRETGDLWVRDLGGKNGTTVRGARFDALPIGGGLDLLIGNALPIRVRQFELGGVVLELPGRVCWLPLGSFELRGHRLATESTPEGWLELRVARGDRVVLGDLWVEGAIQLVRGDEVFDAHGGALLLRVVAPPQEKS
jgi:tetratricopeptide (TPR) repeat protein